MGTNQLRGYVTIDLDKQRRLKFDLNALAEMESVLGIPITEFGDAAKWVTAKNLRAILLIGLKNDDPSITATQIGAMVDMGNMAYVSEKIREAMSSSMGDGVTEEKKA